MNPKLSHLRRHISAALALAALTLALSASAARSDAQHYLADVKALSVPSMEGRGDGTKGLTRAAHLIEERFKSLGLEPAGTQSYFQPFTVITGAKLKADNHLHVGKAELKLNQDYVPFSF